MVGAGVLLIVGLILSTAAGLAWHSSERQHERQAFDTTASNVTAVLATLLLRDEDLITTLRGVLSTDPPATDTAFNHWYSTLDGRDRQVGSAGTAVIADVRTSRLRTFLAQRNSDPAFRTLVYDSVLPVGNSGRSHYCLLFAAGQIEAIDPASTRVIQGDWCSPTSPVGMFMGSLLSSATDTNHVLALETGAIGAPEMVLEAAYFRPGAPTITLAERRAGVAGWVIGTFDSTNILDQAIGSNRGLGVALYHRNSVDGWTIVGTAGNPGGGDTFSRTVQLPNDDAWLLKLHGRSPSAGVSANAQGLLVFAGGSSLTILLVLLILVLSRSRERALRLVADKILELRHLAFHDPLTGLPNRVLALDRAEQMLARARRSQMPVAALHIDIDNFKTINDTFGHPAGDKLLKLVAERLRGVVRESDTAARLSSDEFLVLLEGSPVRDGPHRVAERALAILTEPYDLAEDVGRRLSITASVGVAHGQRRSAEALLGDADVALYVAKSSGKARYVIFQSHMQTAAQDRLTLEMDLKDAADGDQLFLLYQPLVELDTERVVGVEALLRWRHPARGVIGPDVFIPIAEESGLIVPIGRWVLERACLQAAAWHERGHLIGMAVNVSARQLDGDGLLADVQRALEISGISPGFLTLEITETALMRDPIATAERLAALKILGVRVAVDDFGTGYSSLSYLQQFPVDALKIDRSFINAITSSDQALALVQTLVRLGHALDIDTIAEGIEDATQLATLKEHHCGYAQGFLFARPLDPGDLERFLGESGRRFAVTG